MRSMIQFIVTHTTKQEPPEDPAQHSTAHNSSSVQEGGGAKELGAAYAAYQQGRVTHPHLLYQGSMKWPTAAQQSAIKPLPSPLSPPHPLTLCPPR